MSPPPDKPASELIDGNPGTELAANRTSLAFERTKMAADRTLLAMLRTSLSLISFGFTIHQVFAKASSLVDQGMNGRRIGIALLVLGLLTLVMGLFTHASFGRELTHRRERLYGLGLLHRMVPYHVTPTYVVALALLLIGVFALLIIIFRII